MKLLVSAEESGALKEVICVKGTDTSKQQAPQPTSIKTFCQETRNTRIQHFILYKNYVVAARQGGSICIYNSEDEYAEVKKIGSLSASAEDVFVSLFELGDKIYACTEAGNLSIIEPENWVHTTTKLKGPLSSFCGDVSRPGIFAYGGKETDLTVIKLDTMEVLFRGKNVPNNKLDLREPIWISKVAFATDPQDEPDVYKLITVTRYGHVRYYDSTKGRRPVLNFKLSDKPLITMAKLNDCEIVCSDTHVTTAKFNFKNGSMLGKFQGAVGSIKAVHVLDNVLATGGLDRYVRCFDLGSRNTIAKVYMGTQISDVWLVEANEEQPEEKPQEVKPKAKEHNHLEEEGEDDESSDEEEMWQRLQSSLAEKRKRRKLK
ncbi:hypothetical protein KL918_003958 [Ogataea parapolymorpha]|uniref:Ribosome biogenesis protein NSA1 n=1 Tax=Ogataea parapolymorpha (strain ATCC 26012 / BCRC 20466 / JCM 22074 / NRRL Y-7560 / DL-1) TaxID=871575 RepID=W1QEJ2_OGAPD|nr:Ribosome biogenesis protein NSA1 [Ogataea parapolymorpha DL-1]ESW98298.1 Ribosome biogenesis protein NSA1 [Ogataea parapolymorpha DL-1]KAG7865969.1 hypothetical protein KL918_003958 [Ogataea parapolymorpha]KAG7874877.1 hypothetical protein KL916_001121 [Ogataea parapolymorpha]